MKIEKKKNDFEKVNDKKKKKKEERSSSHLNIGPDTGELLTGNAGARWLCWRGSQQENRRV